MSEGELVSYACLCVCVCFPHDCNYDILRIRDKIRKGGKMQ